MGSIIAAFLIGFIVGIIAIVAVALHYGMDDKED